MQDNTTLPTMAAFKKESKAIKKDPDFLGTYNEALNVCAKKHGYKNWNTIRPLLELSDKPILTVDDFISFGKKIIFPTPDSEDKTFPLKKSPYSLKENYISNPFYIQDKNVLLSSKGNISLFDLISRGFPNIAEDRRLYFDHNGPLSLRFLSGQSIWTFYEKGRRAFAIAIDLSFFINRPSSSDYYSPQLFTVHILNEEGLDVILKYASPYAFYYDFVNHFFENFKLTTNSVGKDFPLLGTLLQQLENSYQEIVRLFSLQLDEEMKKTEEEFYFFQAANYIKEYRDKKLAAVNPALVIAETEEQVKKLKNYLMANPIKEDLVSDLPGIPKEEYAVRMATSRAAGLKIMAIISTEDIPAVGERVIANAVVLDLRKKYFRPHLKT